MSINAVLNNALSGLAASQAGMRASSNNISNINTPGYARQEAEFVSRSIGGRSAGVDVAAIRRVTDSYLVTASMRAQARAAMASSSFELLDRAQAAFGDPTAQTSVFGQLNSLFASFAEAANDPASPVRRSSSLSALSDSLSTMGDIATQIQRLRGEADGRVASAVERVNELLQEVTHLNSAVQSGLISGDATGAQNARQQVLDEISSYLDINVSNRGDGAVEIRTTDGLMLAGLTVATLSYESAGSAGVGQEYPQITVTMPGGVPAALDHRISSGELRGLIDLRDRELPALAAEIGEFAAMTADALNMAHNEGAAYPAPQAYAGRNTGLITGDAHGFTGVARLAVLGADGSYINQIDIDFDANQITNNGVVVGAPGATIGSLTTALDAALSGAGAGASATFVNGRLTVTGPTGSGLAFVDDPLGPPTVLEPNGAALSDATRAGRGFAHFFGLNDLVQGNGPLFFETGLADADPHGFTNGQTIDLSLIGPDGRSAIDVTVTVAGATMGDLRTALNTAMAGYGTFDFDTSGNGELSFNPSASYSGFEINVSDDTTARGGTGMSFSRLFGIDDAASSGRVFGLEPAAAVAADTSRLAFGKVAANDRSTGTGSWIALGAGEGSGAHGLHLAAERTLNFNAAGGLPAASTSLLDYAARVASDAGNRAATAERELSAANALSDEAAARRSGVEGVNIEEELVKLTTFQQSFNASARLIQAAKEMTDALLAVI